MPDDIELADGDWVVRVAPEHGGRIAQITHKGLALLVDETQRTLERVHLWGCYPMVPWAGRLRGGRFVHDGTRYSMPINEPPHALHGLATTHEWRVVSTPSSTKASSITMSIDLTVAGDVSPFRGHCEHAVTVDESGVECALELHSHGETFPANIGWHPWFARAWHFDTEFGAMLQRDADNIVTTSRVTPPSSNAMSSSRTLDDCFTDAHRNPHLCADGAQLELVSDCSHWMIYTAPENAFCLEPMSGPPNSLDDSHPDRIVVSPESPLRRAFRIQAVAR